MNTNQMLSRSGVALGMLLLLALCFGGSALAQSGTSTVRGTVADAQGNVVAGATVTLINEEKNFTRTQTTNEQGGYVFSAVPPDTYRVEAETAGFKKTVVSDVRALVDTPTDIDIALEVGAVAETVDVSATTEAPLNTTDASIGTAFESRRIEDLPLNARNVVNLLSLQPGVTRLGEVNGARRDQANVTLDGVDVNEQQSGLDIVTGDAFASVLRSTPDSVQEFRVTTSVPNANQGRSSGAQVSLVTKSGTNEFRGSLYHFHRNTATNANDFFLNRAGQPRPKLIRNLFGGSLGGPIIENRLFFFYNYEGRRDAADTPVLRIVPTATLRQGIVRYENTNGGITTLNPAAIAALFPGTGGVNPAGLALLQTAPLPNSNEIGDGLNTAGFRFNAPTPNKLNTHIARFDLNVTDRQNVFFRANYQDDTFGQASQFQNTPAPNILVTPKGFVAGHAWTLTNSLVNNFRAGLTRQAFERGGDSAQNAVSFRFVYSPFLYQRPLSRTTPVFNITDDVSYIRGSHTIQFGANLRFIRNNRTSFGNSYDTAIVNPSFFDLSGAVLVQPLNGTAANVTDTRNAIAAVLGRFSQYSVNANFDREGNVLPVGTPSVRSFATEEYDVYAQDSWKIRPNLTLNYGLRYSINTPVYERTGFQVKPNVNLGEYFERRVAAAEAGTPLNELITLDLAGKANNRPGFYKTDYNNFAPTVSVAYSPDFGDSFFGRAFGRNGRSVIRGGFRMIYDRVGSALAVNFDLNNSLGFASSTTISANTFDVSSNPGPLLTGLGQNVRVLPGVGAPSPIRFPLTNPPDEEQRIEQAIDESLTTPVQYTYNASYGRELPKGFSFELSYVGRNARNLLVSRDAMHLNNLRDPQSGQDWYTAVGILTDLRAQNVPLSAVPRIPYFENLFPGFTRVQPSSAPLGGQTLTPSQNAYRQVANPSVGGRGIIDYTFVQLILDDRSRLGRNAFFHPQYAALGMYSTIGTSDYHGASISLRQRFKSSFLFDFNYTLSKSLDTGSNLESNATYANFLVQPLDINAQRAVSDFDARHIINANFLADMPVGRNRRFLSGIPKIVDAFIGGFQLGGVFRYNSGLPARAPFDAGLWATNWNVQSNAVRIGNVRSDNVRTTNGGEGGPNIFADPEAASRLFRNARAGEAGDRNILREPFYIVFDASLTKRFNIGLRENDYLQFRVEAFNVTNTQRFTGISALGLGEEPFLGGAAPSDFGAYTDTQKPVGDTNARPGRVFQFALRYVF